MQDGTVSYKPSAWYYRKAIRSARTIEQASEAGLVAVLELEELKAWIREQGLIPPKRFVLRSEAEAKGWLADELQPLQRHQL